MSALTGVDDVIIVCTYSKAFECACVQPRKWEYKFVSFGGMRIPSWAPLAPSPTEDLQKAYQIAKAAMESGAGPIIHAGKRTRVAGGVDEAALARTTRRKAKLQDAFKSRVASMGFAEEEKEERETDSAAVETEEQEDDGGALAHTQSRSRVREKDGVIEGGRRVEPSAEAATDADTNASATEAVE